MSADTPPVPQRHWLLWALACWGAALVLTFAGFVLSFHSGPWTLSGETTSIMGSQLKVHGGSRVDGGSVIFHEPDSAGNLVAVVNFDNSLDASHFRLVSVHATGGIPTGGLSFAWRVQGDERTVRKTQLDVSGGRILPMLLGKADGWTGRVVGIGLVAKGDFSAPLAVSRIDLLPASVWTTVKGIVSDWAEFEPWDGGSINFLAGGNSDPRRSLTLFAGTAFIGATFLYFLLVVLGHTKFQPQVVLAIPLMAWVLVDFRWQANLWRQLSVTWDQYAGKSWEAKRLAAEDGRLFGFIRDAKAKIGDDAVRVFVFADEEFDRMRGAYHLYPANVAALRTRQSILPAAVFRPGDVLVIIRKRGVEYSPAEKRLRWGGTESVRAEMVHFSAGSAAFRVLPPA